ncbi:MAG TPA: dTDP-4-dehydrorhamnose 3,5-epimerase family protein [Gemmataceae bacterium]|nr:dTDP-4-dehydrorhamnose 3,5-epimerase family protein [Gemmataceae bacterium]
MSLHPAPIAGVIWKPLRRFTDERGWLCELFRHDELPAEFHPAMAYASVTQPGVARGPHEHVDQADYFCFFGPSNFKVYLWDNRPASPTYRVRQTDVVGVDKPMALIVPAGVVHAYQNVGREPGLVFNAPNRLYRGPGKKDPVDEIRHEDQADSPYRLV